MLLYDGKETASAAFVQNTMEVLMVFFGEEMEYDGLGQGVVRIKKQSQKTDNQIDVGVVAQL